MSPSTLLDVLACGDALDASAEKVVLFLGRLRTFLQWPPPLLEVIISTKEKKNLVNISGCVVLTAH
jgi:hypothetical protein